MIKAALILKVPWAPSSRRVLDTLTIERGTRDLLTYDDGITLEVRVLDPTTHGSAQELLSRVEAQQGPGRAVLVAGSIPVQWRAPLRATGVSFIDAAGAVEIFWPRLRISASRFGRPVKRQRDPLPIQRGHALVAQELLVTATDGSSARLADVAAGAGVSLSTASRAITSLAEHGVVAKELVGRQVKVSVVARADLAERLAERTSWPGGRVMYGYLWGRNTWEVAAELSAKASDANVAVAVTGRAGAAFLGVFGTGSPPALWCWLDVAGRSLAEAAELLRLEPASADEANVILAGDRWQLGTHHRASATLDGWTATISHPVRVWCDLHSEQRGAQLWDLTSNAE